MDASRCRHSPWRQLVLVASLLTCWICQISSQISIIPVVGFEGFQSFLDIENVPKGVQEYSWYRGTNDSAEYMIVSHIPSPKSWQSGPMSSGRENVSRLGTLVIKDSMLNDTGNYTVRVEFNNGSQTATGWLEVQELEDNPGISANVSSVVEEMDPVAAFCHTNITDATKIKWYVNGLQVSSSDRVTFSSDRKTLIMHQLSRFDRTLQCATEYIDGLPLKSDPIILTVFYGPDNVRLRSEPYTFRGVLSAEIGSRVQMNCTSTSYPRSQNHWIHNGSFLSSSASITFPSLTWEQMGNYRCIVKNSVTQITMYSDVRIQRPFQFPVIRTDFSISGYLVIGSIVMIVLGGVYLCGILVYALITHFSTREERERERARQRERRGEELEVSTPICALTRQAQGFEPAISAFPEQDGLYECSTQTWRTDQMGNEQTCF
ncbi:carcinoembryonic antigen-related cell adhesion molecule 18 isoform X2 [Saccopteryx bilineata]|uniref:carcinoembryonic antigen-related cell adhesion molecule 18 isoform X2 n=1 Tax=Saccopteryx bilineata TaxID=59482 RepID=UPI00338ECDA2